MPLPFLNAFARMLPRLQAEERLVAMNVTAAGTGAMTASDREEFVGRLQDAIVSGEPPLLTMAERLEAAAAVGIKVEVVSHV